MSKFKSEDIGGAYTSFDAMPINRISNVDGVWCIRYFERVFALLNVYPQKHRKIESNVFDINRAASNAEDDTDKWVLRCHSNQEHSDKISGVLASPMNAVQISVDFFQCTYKLPTLTKNQFFGICELCVEVISDTDVLYKSTADSPMCAVCRDYHKDSSVFHFEYRLFLVDHINSEECDCKDKHGGIMHNNGDNYISSYRLIDESDLIAMSTRSGVPVKLFNDYLDSLIGYNMVLDLDIHIKLNDWNYAQGEIFLICEDHCGNRIVFDWYSVQTVMPEDQWWKTNYQDFSDALREVSVKFGISEFNLSVHA